MSIVSRKFFWIFVSVLLIVLSMWKFGNRQLGGFDMSALVDTGWRMAIGQKPYLDFPLTTPIAFYIGAGWAVQILGAKWTSFVIAAILFAVISFLAQTYILGTVMPWQPALLISLVCQLLCSVVVSYWWYNSITMSSACLFLTAAYIFARQPVVPKSVITLWGTLTLLSLMKPNIAGGLAVSVFVVLFLFLPHRKRIVAIGLASLISFFLILLLLRISPLDVIHSYIDISKGRATPSIKWFFNDKPYEYLVVIPLIFLCLVPFMERISRITVHWNALFTRTYLALTVVSLLMGLLSLVTNSDSNLVVGVPFFLLGSTVCYYLTSINPERSAPQKIWRFIAAICVAMTLAGSTIIQANYRAEGIAPNMFSFWFIEVIFTGIIVFFLLLIPDDFAKNGLFARNWMKHRLILASLFMCGCVAFFASGMRWRVSYIGYESFFTHSSLTEIDNIPFFKGFQVSPRAKTTMLEIQNVLQEKYGSRDNWKEASIYFGPRIEFAYAAFDILSPLNLPIWWHPDNSYPKYQTEYFSQSFIDHNFEIAVFMKIPKYEKPDFGFLPGTLVNNFLLNYKQVDYPSIVVFYKK